MYKFLTEHLPDLVLQNILKDLTRTAKVDLSEVSPEGFGSYIFSIYGYSALADREFRRVLIYNTWDTLPQAVRDMSEQSGISKPYDRALYLSGLAWTRKAKLLQALSDHFDIESVYLPGISDPEPTREIISSNRSIPILFPYQSEVIDLASKFVREQRPALVCLPTGSGKTRVAAELAVENLAENSSKMAVLWVSLTDEVCRATFDTVEALWMDKGVRPIQFCRYWGPHMLDSADFRDSIIFTTFGKVTSPRGEILIQKVLTNISLVIVDEAHRSNAATYRNFIATVVAARIPALGFTATPGRWESDIEENYGLASLFSNNLIEPPSLLPNPVERLREMGVLSLIEYVIISGSLHGTGGEKAQLRVLEKISERNEKILSCARTECKEGPTLVFCCSVDHGRFLSAKLNLRGIPSACVHSDLTRNARREIMAAFKSGSITVLFNFGILSTGLDIPKLHCIIVARPTDSYVLYSQMVGRALRGPAVGGTPVSKVIEFQDGPNRARSVSDIHEHFRSFWGQSQ